MRPLTIGICVICLSATAPTAAESERSDWYFTASLGWAGKSGLDQNGTNRDNICYPTDACFGVDAGPRPVVPGYRWRYGIDADTGPGFDFSLGRDLGRWRVEVSSTRSTHDLEQRFVSIEYLDGSPRLPLLADPLPGTQTVRADVETDIDGIATTIIALNAYRTWSLGSMTTFLGVGAGAAFVEVPGVHFSAEYTSDAPPEFDPPWSRYNGSQDVDLSDTVPAGLLHVGAEYPVTDRMSVGGKLTYSHVGEITDTGVYIDHPMHNEDPDFSNENSFDAALGWSLSFTVRYRLRQ